MIKSAADAGPQQVSRKVLWSKVVWWSINQRQQATELYATTEQPNTHNNQPIAIYR